MKMKRPIGVTILAALAALAAVLAAIHTLQFLGIFPFVIGPVSVHGFSLLYALMYGLLVWVYIWLVQMLWNVDKQAWIFLVIITLFNLSVNFIAMLGATTWQDLSLSIFVNAIILLYCMLPGVKDSFGVA
jgi:hypothetical protein